MTLDTEKLNFEGQKLQQKDEMDKERLQSQEDQAELRAEVTLAGQRRKNNGRKHLSQAVIDRLMKKYKKKMGARVGDPKQICKNALQKVQKYPTFMKKGGHVRKKTKKRSENELLTVVSKMAYDLRHEDQMALSAAFMVAAKTIYINQLGMEQTQDLFQAMADSMDIV